MRGLGRVVPLVVGFVLGVALAAGALGIADVAAVAVAAILALLVVSPAQLALLLLLGRLLGYRLNRAELGQGPVVYDHVSALWSTVRLIPVGYAYSAAAISRAHARQVWRNVAWIALVPVAVAAPVLPVVPAPPVARIAFLGVLVTICVMDARTRWMRSALAPTAADGWTDPDAWALINRSIACPGDEADAELATWVAMHPDDVPVLQAAVLRAWARADDSAALEYEALLERAEVDGWWLANTRLATLCLAAERGEAPAGWEAQAATYESQLDDRALDPAVQETLALSRVLQGDVTGAEELVERAMRLAGGAGVDANGYAHLAATQALVLAARGRHVDAARALERARRRSPHDPRWSATERCMTGLGQAPRAGGEPEGTSAA